MASIAVAFGKYNIWNSVGLQTAFTPASPSPSGWALSVDFAAALAATDKTVQFSAVLARITVATPRRGSLQPAGRLFRPNLGPRNQPPARQSCTADGTVVTDSNPLMPALIKFRRIST